MPAIKEGESEKDYVSRCIPVRIREKGESPEQASAACHGMYKQHQEKGTNYFEPPPAGDLGETGKKILSKVYSECRNKWVKEHPDDRENAHNKESCARIAWTAVHNAGYDEINKREYMRLDLCNDGAITLDDDNAKIEFATPETVGDGKYEKYHAIAIIGDRFYKGKFFPATELNKAHIDGTIHDINHMATTFDVDIFGNPRQNIEYEVGFQKGQSYKDKKLHTEIYIKKDAPKYQAWKNHIDLCRDIGKTPNLSISFYHNTKQILGKDLPDDTNFQEYGYTRESMIPCITDVDIQALSTVFKGACTEKDGCGIGINFNQPIPIIEGKKEDLDLEILNKKRIELEIEKEKIRGRKILWKKIKHLSN